MSRYTQDDFDQLQAAFDRLFIAFTGLKQNQAGSYSTSPENGFYYSGNQTIDTNQYIPIKPVFVYGSASYDYNMGQDKAGFGVFWPEDDHKDLSLAVLGQIRTHNRALLMAVLNAIQQDSRGRGELRIYTNNSYVYKIFTIWHMTWRRNNWTLANGDEPKNLDLIFKILNHIDKRNGTVEFYLINWRDGFDELGEARELAREAMFSY